MKQINVYFDDEDYKVLLKRKGDRSWRDFILESSEAEKNELR